MATKVPNGMPVSVRGVIASVTYANEESGYCVLRMDVDVKSNNIPANLLNQKNQIIITGAGLHGVPVGEIISVNGIASSHPKFGNQIQVNDYVIDTPKSDAEMIKFLSGHIAMISVKLASKIVEKYGCNALDIIEHTPEKLTEIKLIGVERLERIKEAWSEMSSDRELLMFFIQIGLPSRFKHKCLKRYGDDLKDKITADPYRLAREINGVGWAIADEVAKKMGIHEASDLRIRAAAYHLLSEQRSDGHCFMFLQDLAAKTVNFLKLPNLITQDECLRVLHDAVKYKILILDERRVYLPFMAVHEMYAAKRLTDLLSLGPYAGLPSDEKLKKDFDIASTELSIEPDETQKNAVWLSLKSRVSIITGGPGTGKSTIVKLLTKTLDKIGLPVLLMAPTGRAAKRIHEVTGMNASTVHYALAMCAVEKRQLEGVIVVDEWSMGDIVLMSNLMQVVSDDCMLVFVGDVDQLPPVGPGAVLRDMIDSGVIPYTRLTQIYRQAAQSDIILNAHAINKGYIHKLNRMGRDCGIPQNTDYFTCLIEDSQQQIGALAYLIHKFIPSFGFDPNKDMQIATPMRGGPVGVHALNAYLKPMLNPHPTDTHQYGDAYWSVGDRMMNLKNNRKLALSNGDQGILTSINRENGKVSGITIDFDSGMVKVPSDWFCHIEMAYASTVHKLQGDQRPVVIVFLHTSHSILLQRSLFFTAMTRAQKLNILIAHPSAMATALSRNNSLQRNTYLSERLRNPKCLDSAKSPMEQDDGE